MDDERQTDAGLETIALGRLSEERRRLHHRAATLSSASRGRPVPEPDDSVRTCYERDGHRILHAKPFRRLRNKTQVFFSPENDHIATRMDHSLYVATISRTICRALGLNDDLAFAIALGHDLGHPPFGHSGERVLDQFLTRRTSGEADLRGFVHEAQSLRVVDLLASSGGAISKGLNLTYEVRDGIRCHCGESTDREVRPRDRLDSRDPATFTGRGTLPITIEGCVVRLADRIAYLGRDYEDAQVALSGLLPPLPEVVTERLGQDNRQVINSLAVDVIRMNQRRPEVIGFSPAIHEAMIALRSFNYSNIYENERMDDYRGKIEAILKRIFEVSLDHLERRPVDRWGVSEPGFPLHLGALARFVAGAGYDTPPPPARVVVDFISLMTDGYAFKIFESISIPQAIV